MASNKKIIEIFALFNSVNSLFLKGYSKEERTAKAQTWGMLLANYTDEEVNNAAIVCAQTCTMPPTPADIINQIKRSYPKQTSDELFDIMVKALEECDELQYHFDFTARTESGKTQGQEAREKAQMLFDNLPPEIKLYIGSYGEFKRMARDLDDETLKYERIRFKKDIGECQQETQTRQLISSDIEKLRTWTNKLIDKGTP